MIVEIECFIYDLLCVVVRVVCDDCGWLAVLSWLFIGNVRFCDLYL